MPLRVLYEDEHLIAVDKPAGFIVHQREDAKKISHRRCCLQILRDQIGMYVFPIHRLDQATSGVLLFAKHKEAAQKLHAAWQSGEVHKTYACLVRGFFTEQKVERALKNERGSEQTAITHFEPLFQKEIPVPTERHETSRYTFLLASPETGRFHQIRRHLAHAAHPIIGDKRHGDSAQNRFFLGVEMPWLYLRAVHLSFPHPVNDERITVEASWNGKWHKVFDWLGFCPTTKQLRFFRGRASLCESSLGKIPLFSPE